MMQAKEREYRRCSRHPARVAAILASKQRSMLETTSGREAATSCRSPRIGRNHVRTFGPVVRLELDLVEGGRMMEAHIPRDRFVLALTKGRRGPWSRTWGRLR